MRIVVALTILILLNSLLYAQDSTSLIKEGVVPQLNNHRFIGSQALNSPFTKSNFQLYFGYGSSDPLGSREFTVGDTTLELSLGTLLFINVGTELNIKLKDWISYNFKYSYSAKIGSETNVTLTNGIQQYSNFSNAWRIRLLEKKSHYLSTSIGISNTTTEVLDLENYLNNINNGDLTPQSAEKYYTLRGTFEINYAWGITDVLGLVVNTGLTYGDLFVAGETGLNGNVAAGLDLNLYPKTKVPLGLTIAYAYRGSNDFEMPSDGTRLSARLAYTRSNSFLISFDFTSNKVPYSTYLQSTEEEKTDVLTSFIRFVMFL